MNLKINKLKINSYGKLKEKEIELNNGINIIYGKNESGKSTLLKFIVNSFYGISKNKKGKEYSDLEKYTPWEGEDFSGKIEYELDNGKKYEVYRDFKKKNPKIFNENMEDISKEFNIDKSKGNEFFYEQTNIDEELFLSTVVVGQAETRLGKQEQTVLVQKISNLVGTGNDNVSYKRAIDRINRRQLDEIGTDRSREKPINILERKIQNLEEEKNELKLYENKKYDLEEEKNKLNNEIINLENEKNYLKDLKIIFEKENLENEKIKIKENIKKENNEKINLIKNKINKIKNKNKNNLDINFEKIKNNKSNLKNKLKKNLIFFLILAILVNVLQVILIKNIILNIVLILTVVSILIFYYFWKNKKIKEKEKTERNNINNYEKINLEINNLKNEENILEKNNNNLENELINLKNKLNLKINLEKEKINNNYLNKIEKNRINDLINLENNSIKIIYEIENLQNIINNKKIELNKIDLEQKNIEPKLDNLSKIEEELVNNNDQMNVLKNNNLSFNLAKQTLESAYEEMKKTVTPKFTKELSYTISKITDNKYKNIMFNDEEGLIVELENGSYVPASKLSIGTIDQLYLSLRFSMVEELSEEKLPIILDEAFAYYDKKRLKNILIYLNNKFKNNQIIIFTCTDREKEILNNLNLECNFINL